VTSREIAARLGLRKYQTVHNRSDRYPDLPPPRHRQGTARAVVLALRREVGESNRSAMTS
jgi:hypothetical protein